MVDNKLAQTYVWHNGKAFFVSTINRENSSPLAYGSVYAETMVWVWNQTTRKRGKLVGVSEGGKDSIRAHQAMVKRIFDTGLCESEDIE